MTKAEFTSTLSRWAEGAQTTLSPVAKDVFQIVPKTLDTKRLTFIRFEPDGDNEVYLVHYFVVSGKLRNVRALPHLLAMNRGGVRGSDFFFSLQKREGEMYVILETKHANPALDNDTLYHLIFNWWLHPLFIMTWDIPEGVENFGVNRPRLQAGIGASVGTVAPESRAAAAFAANAERAFNDWIEYVEIQCSTS